MSEAATHAQVAVPSPLPAGAGEGRANDPPRRRGRSERAHRALRSSRSRKRASLAEVRSPPTLTSHALNVDSFSMGNWCVLTRF